MRDPKEYRAHAESCRRIAAGDLIAVWDRHTLIYMAVRWEQLARELDPAKPPGNVTSLHEWLTQRDSPPLKP